MKTIGLVGEAPNDTESIKNLLSKEYEVLVFITLLNNIRGSLLEDDFLLGKDKKKKKNQPDGKINKKIKVLLRIEYQSSKPDIVIFIRDLDSLKSNKHQLQIRKKYFAEVNSVVDKKGIYLLNIFEIEALILADIKTFNSIYHTKIEAIEDVMEVVEPKEFLKSKANGYSETQNAKVFQQLNFQQILSCAYFQAFVADLDELLS